MEQEKKESARPIIEQITEYAETRFKLVKLEVIDRSTSIIAGIVTDIVIILALILTFLFASFTLALYLGDVLGANWKGFGCIAAFYLLIALVVIFAKNAFERPIINVLVRKLFK